MTFGMQCSCGDEITVRGRTRDDAVRKMKTLLTEDAFYEHMAQKHMNEGIPPIQLVHAAIEQNLKMKS